MNALIFVCAGIASWWTPLPMYGNAYVCASNDVPSGTHLRIVNVDNRKESPCVVVGTGPFVSGRVLDVSPSVAKRLGFYSSGLAHVRVYREIRVKPHRSKPKVWSHP